MATTIGSIRRMCPYCCDDIFDHDDYELAREIPGSEINGMTIHARCAVQRDHAAAEGHAEFRSPEVKP